MGWQVTLEWRGTVFYTCSSHTLSNGDRVAYGGEGKVTGPGSGAEKDKRVAVTFPGNKGNINCLLTQLSRTAPPMTFSSGYSCGGTVFFTGEDQALSDDNRLVNGAEGKITGPGNGADKDKRVCVMFPGNKANINCLLRTLSRTAP